MIPYVVELLEMNEGNEIRDIRQPQFCRNFLDAFGDGLGADYGQFVTLLVKHRRSLNVTAARRCPRA